MKGYKVFNSNWACRGFQYKVGETYEMDEEPKICAQGFHFCTKLYDCFHFYPFSPDTRIAEVEALGDIVSETVDHTFQYYSRLAVQPLTSKHCTNKIKILREIPYDQLEITYDYYAREWTTDEPKNPHETGLELLSQPWAMPIESITVDQIISMTPKYGKPLVKIDSTYRCKAIIKFVKDVKVKEEIMDIHIT